MDKENRCDLKPLKGKYVVVKVANINEIMYPGKGTIAICREEEAGNKISRLTDGYLVDYTEESFEENFVNKPSIGDRVAFNGYSGQMRQTGDEFYRVLEDKFIIGKVEE